MLLLFVILSDAGIMAIVAADMDFFAMTNTMKRKASAHDGIPSPEVALRHLPLNCSAMELGPCLSRQENGWPLRATSGCQVRRRAIIGNKVTAHVMAFRDKAQMWLFCATAVFSERTA